MLYDMYVAAVTILNDGCPDRAGFRSCHTAEDPEQCTDCKMCWQTYLMWLLNQGFATADKKSAAKIRHAAAAAARASAAVDR